MTGLICALQAEAEMLISKLSLKQKPWLKGFSCFSDEEKNIILVVSGTGKINSAAAVSSLLQAYECNQLILFSSSAGLKGQKAGEVFLINRITDLETGMSFYPDLLLQCSLPEASLLTGDLALGMERKTRDTKTPYHLKQLLNDTAYQSYDLYDMDAAGAVMTAEKFLGPHQIHAIKVVTDNGSKIDLTAFRKFMQTGTEAAFPYMQAVLSIPAFSEKNFQDLEKTAQEMHCSETMKAQLKQLYTYASAAGIDPVNILQQMHYDGMLPCHTREEGKKALHEFAIRLTA